MFINFKTNFTGEFGIKSTKSQSKSIGKSIGKPKLKLSGKLIGKPNGKSGGKSRIKQMEFRNPTIANTEIQSLRDYKNKFGYRGFAAKIGYKHYKKVYIRTRAAESQNWKCCFCGIRMTDTPNKPDSCTAEHIIPHSEGGEWTKENIVASCSWCNLHRGTMSAEEFDPFEVKKERKNRGEKRMRRYRKRIEKFATEGFNLKNMQINSLDTWLATLRIDENYVEQLKDYYHECKVA
jgi:hypothetical protein